MVAALGRVLADTAAGSDEALVMLTGALL